ncbi:MAG: hypothetical protein JWN79_3099 [Gemmatimonadetes bacterium]|jgi:hypothetical protein|nr:hypothetical protein [Gemmatimonadota bacterium]
MRAPAAATLACLAAAACTHPARYDVFAAGYTGGVASSIAPGTPVTVVHNPRVTNPLLEQEVLAQLRTLLASAGYPSAPIDQARVAIFVDYGTGSHAETRHSLTYVPGATTILRDSSGKQIGTATASDTFGTEAETVHTLDRWLTMTAVDAGAFRAGQPAMPLWIGEATNSGATLDLRRMLHVLTVPAAERFGRNTQQARVTLAADDARIGAPPLP